MGVINNLINIKKIVGNKWDGTTISKIIENRPFPVIIDEPEIIGTAIRFTTNVRGFVWYLDRLSGDNWVNVLSNWHYGRNPSIDIPETLTSGTVCRVRLNFLGTYYEDFIFSKEFTITRTAAQSAKMQNDVVEEVTDVEVEKESIKKG